MVGIFVVSIAAVLAFAFPMAGIAVWMLAMTIGTKMIADYHLNSSLVSLADALMASSLLRLSMPAFARIVTGRFREIEPIYVLFWLMSAIVLLSGALTRGIDQTAVFEAMWFGPLLLAVHQLDEDRRRALLLIVVAVSALIGLIAMLLSMSGSSWLATHVQMQLQAVSSGAPTTETTNARVVMPGIWTIAPFGLWVCLGLLAAGRFRRSTRVWLALSAIAIFLGLVVNYSRSVAVPLVAGIVALTIVASFCRRHWASRQVLLVVGCLVLLGGITLAVRPNVREAWMTRFFGENRYGTVDARIQATDALYGELKRKGDIIGEASAVDVQSIVRMGDPFGPLLVWERLGFIGMVAFGLIAVFVPLAALRRALIASWSGRKMTWSSIVTFGYSFYFVALLLSGFYFHCDVLVPLVLWHWLAGFKDAEATDEPIAMPLPESVPS